MFRMIIQIRNFSFSLISDQISHLEAFNVQLPNKNADIVLIIYNKQIMYTQQPQFHQIPSQFYPNQNYGFAQPQFPQVVYSNRKLEHINCVIPASDQAGGLYIGDTISTLKQEILVANNIKAILCCNVQAAKNIYSIYIPMDFQYINIQDHVQYPIKIHFDNAISFIQSKIKNKMNVLVQCHGGASRSATIICAYLIKAKSWNYEQALQFLKEKRPRVKPNQGFLLQLQEYSRRMNKQDQKQEEKKNQNEISKQIQQSLQKDNFSKKQDDKMFQTPKRQNKDEDNISQGKKQIRQVQSNKVDRNISEIKSLQHTPDKNKFHTQKKRLEIFSPKKSFNPPTQKPKQNLRHSITGTDLPYTFFTNQNNKYMQKIQQPFSSPQPQHKVPTMNYTNPIFYSPQNTYQNTYQTYQNNYIHPQPFQVPQAYNQVNYIDQQFQSNGYKTFNGGYGTSYMNTYPVGSRGY